MKEGQMDRVSGAGYVDFGKSRTWLVVRKRETGPPEVWAFDRYDQAAVFFDRAQQQWSDVWFCTVTAGPGDPRPSVPAEWFCETSLTTSRDELAARKCPFCGDDGYDLSGLKLHLMAGWCDGFNATETP